MKVRFEFDKANDKQYALGLYSWPSDKGGREFAVCLVRWCFSIIIG